MQEAMTEPTDDWLERVNDRFRENNVPYKQRPWMAWMEWSQYAGTSTSLGDQDVKKIFQWFEENTIAHSQYIGPMYVGVFYYDSAFWPVFIPVVMGRAKLEAADSLKTMPDSIKARLMKSKPGFLEFVHFWAACIDFGFGIKEVASGQKAGAFARELFASGNQQLNATVTLLREDIPNPKAIESARMATEMFLKAFLAYKAGLTEKEAKDKLGHDLVKALDRCLAIDPKLELVAVRPELSCFPEVGERYKGTEKTPGHLWHGYGVAQFTGATVVRSLTGRDVRKTLR
jgi:hypothetical protein